ncbi:hypothetical protein J3492_09580 [Psychrobacter sp. F1192]|uniref:Uncharacterized protein n=1 Tax=Psychrobacter coccoides TaxID=2818440 RepID=A0ABS3NQ01_9GAMM|nr:hypothetical protein [Psychrobacter coccoides]MBO1531458.1 hypothetical protein [Psychrobacter coccoides]
MNNNQSTKEQLLHKANGLTEREVAATLAILNQYHNDIVIIRDKDYLLRRLQQTYLDQGLLLVLLNDVKSVLVPEESSNWITKDLRASLWFYNYYHNHLTSNIHLAHNSLSNHVDYLITGIDCSFMLLNPPIYSNDSEQLHIINNYNFGLEYKLTVINDTKRLYHSILTERKYTDWIDINDIDQLYWAVDYLRKAGMLVQNVLFLAQDNKDTFAQICASLDTIDNFHNMNYQYTPTANKRFFISNMRKAWSQKKFRDKKDAETAQEHFLTRRHMNRLKKLASEYGVSSAEYLQQLIDEAYDSTD